MFIIFVIISQISAADVWGERADYNCFYVVKRYVTALELYRSGGRHFSGKYRRLWGGVSEQNVNAAFSWEHEGVQNDDTSFQNRINKTTFERLFISRSSWNGFKVVERPAKHHLW